MPGLVVTQQGAVLRCRRGRIEVEFEKTLLRSVPQEQVERVLLLGGVNMTHGFLNFALERRIQVTFLTREGNYRGRLESAGRRDVRLRIAQYRKLTDLDWRLHVSMQIVRAKIGAQRGLLLRQARNHEQEAITSACAQLAQTALLGEQQETLPRLMGVEGRAARIYFGALPLTLRRPMPFRGRSRRPPRDPMNALLSLGYGMLTTEIIGALIGCGLDPQIGIFHSSRGRMPALAEDVIEMFRAPAADLLALSLVNLGILKEADFEKQENEGYLLTKPALETYLRHYRRRMTTSYRNRAGEVTSLRREIQAHAAHLRRVLLDEEPYAPFVAPSGGSSVRGKQAEKPR